jgi:eukaryotic-like serine/threonine-protein kinase
VDRDDDQGATAAMARLTDRYELGPTIGEGGMGEIRECRDLVLDRSVALKSVRRDRHALELEARFVREACVQAQLEHPCIVPVYEVGRGDDGVSFFTMRRVEGITLEDVLRRRRAGDRAIEESFTRHRLLTAFAQICLALDSAHASGVLHRDLKPANVMFGDFGEVYLLDWGVAKLTGDDATGAALSSPVAAHLPQPDQTLVGAALGTPAYMAPEQFAVRPLDARADVFALGAVLFEILTLVPLLDDDAMAARTRGGHATWDARPSVRAPSREVPPEFDRICVRATAESPEKRYASARELHDALDAYLGGERDLELRRRLARAHLAQAELAQRNDPDGALLEVNRALALDPDDPRALALLVELLRATPAAAAKARQDVVSEGIERLRRAQPLGALLFVAPWVTIYPLVIALRGVRDPWLAAVPVVAWALAGLTILIDWRQGTQERVVYPTVTIMMAIATTSLLFGPLFLMPGLAVTSIANMVLISARRLRVISVALACAAVAIPTAAAWLGIHDVYHFENETTFTITGLFTTFRPRNLSVLLVTCDLIMLVSAAVFAGTFREQIDRARSENALFAWQLSQLLPAAASEVPLPSGATAPDQARPTVPDAIERILDTAIDAQPRGNYSAGTALTTTPAGDPAAPGARGLDLDGPRYVDLGPLTEDATAVVSECHDRLIGRDVAMKRLRPELCGRADLEPRFSREALLQARLDHPRIPAVYDLGRDEHGPWFSTKLVRGTPLTGLLREPPSAHERQRRLAAFAQVCLTLDFAHNRGVVHRALEPASILLGEFGEVYVVGWGRAKASIAEGALADVVDLASRAASYTAPEQTAGDAVDARADVFALGTILYEIITGQPLFGGDHRFSVVLGKYDARPSALGLAQAVSSELDDICAKATAYDAADRHASARELHDALDAFLARDRDEVLRRGLAAERLEQATKSAEHALAAADETTRVEALREVGRALALAPDRAPALRLLERLLRTPPSPLPTPVTRELDAASWTMSRRASPATALTYVILWLVIFPVIALLSGVRDLVAVCVVAFGWTLAAGVLYMQGTRTTAPPLPWASITGLFAVSLTSLVLGPHIIVPAFAIAMTMGYVLGGRTEWRRAIVTLGCAAIALPALLIWLGVLGVYDLGPSTPLDTFILHGALRHPASALLPGLMIGNVAAVVVAAAYAAHFRDTLEQIEAENRAKILALSRLVS